MEPVLRHGCDFRRGSRQLRQPPRHTGSGQSGSAVAFENPVHMAQYDGPSPPRTRNVFRHLPPPERCEHRSRPHRRRTPERSPIPRREQLLFQRSSTEHQLLYEPACENGRRYGRLCFWFGFGRGLRYDTCAWFAGTCTRYVNSRRSAIAAASRFEQSISFHKRVLKDGLPGRNHMQEHRWFGCAIHDSAAQPSLRAR